MPTIRNQRDHFFQAIENRTDYDTFSEMNSLLDSHACDTDFFNLCKSFLDISLNSKKMVNNDSSTVNAYFQEDDILNAKNNFFSFATKFEIHNLTELLETIKLFYPYAYDSDDLRHKADILKKDCPPFYGYYVDFCKLPEDIWCSIANEILNVSDK